MKKLKNMDEMDADVIHNPFFPHEIRENDGISVKIMRSETWAGYRLWNYSPFGIEILAEQGEFKQGEVVSINLCFIKEDVVFDSIRVASIKDKENHQIVGFRTFRRPEALNNNLDRRKFVRWACPQDLLPTGSAPNPIQFNDYIIFRIEDISSGGCRLITSMRNKFVFEGMFLESSLSLPLVGNVNATLKIVYIDTTERDGKPYIIMGANFVKPDSILLSCLAEYLLHFGHDISTDTLKKDGFVVRPNLATFDFSYVKTQGEYEEVLELRRKAYIHANKVDPHIKAIDMADVYDSRARILIAKKNARVVGSVRVMFHDSYEDSELYKDGVKEIPGVPFSEAVEASRLCIDLNYRGIDIAHSLLSHFSLTAIKANKRYIFGGATGFLVDFYRKAGWKIHDSTYTFSSLNGIPHHTIYVDLHEVIRGINVSPSVWNRLYKEMFYYLSERGIIKASPLDLFRIRLFQFFDF